MDIKHPWPWGESALEVRGVLLLIDKSCWKTHNAKSCVFTIKSIEKRLFALF